MLRVLWTLDALVLLVALGIALSASREPAGQGVIWAFPVLLAAALAASVVASRVGAPRLAAGIGLVAPAVAAVVLLTVGRSLIGARAEASGTAYWSDPAVRTMAQAIASGSPAAMRSARTPGLDLNAVGRDGTTLLTFAIDRHPAMIAPLLALGADPNFTPPNTLPPLARAVRAFDPAFTALLDGGADANGPGDHEAPVIFQAIRDGALDRYRALVAHGADITRRDATGRTTLVAAAEGRQWAIALDLLDRGVDPSLAAADGTTVRAVLDRMLEDEHADAGYRAVRRRVYSDSLPR